FFSSRRRHTRFSRDWSSDVCSSDLGARQAHRADVRRGALVALSPRADRRRAAGARVSGVAHSRKPAPGTAPLYRAGAPAPGAVELSPRGGAAAERQGAPARTAAVNEQGRPKAALPVIARWRPTGVCAGDPGSPGGSTGALRRAARAWPRFPPARPAWGGG